jgi:DNA-binding GntR family transcriptional regulator
LAQTPGGFTVVALSVGEGDSGILCLIGDMILYTMGGDGQAMTKVSETKDAEAYHYLRKQILSNNFRPGQRLREDELCRDLNVTRTPLRSALRRLEQERLVVGEPYRGCRVREVGQEEIGPIFDLRAALEALAAGNIARSADPQVLDMLEKLAIQCDDAWNQEQWHEYFEIDKKFHWTVVQNSQNPHLIEVLEVYSFQLRTFILHQQYLLFIVEQLRTRSDEMAHSHFDLVQAMRESPEAAERQMQAHIRGGKRMILEACSQWQKTLPIKVN